MLRSDKPEARAGSSPRVRGLLAGGVDDSHAVGIIPARAGFTIAVLVEVAAAGDHPRACGVY